MALDDFQILRHCYDSEKQALRIATDGPAWTKYTVVHGDFTDADTSQEINIATLPAGSVLHAVKLKHSAAFTGGSLTTYTVSVGVSGGSATAYLSAQNVLQAPGAAVHAISSNTTPWLLSSGATTTITATATGSHALNTATTGSVDIWLLTSIAT